MYCSISWGGAEMYCTISVHPEMYWDSLSGDGPCGGNLGGGDLLGGGVGLGGHGLGGEDLGDEDHGGAGRRLGE